MTLNTKNMNRFWGEKPIPKSKAEFFNAVTMPAPVGEGTVATIRLYGPIDSWGGFWGISTKDVGQVLDALPETVTQVILRINSPGGEVFEGVSILNMLRAHKASVTAVVDGLAASAASVIAAGCDETVMSPGTQMMIHSPWTFTLGNATQLRKDADRLEGIESSLIEIYQAKAGDADWSTLLAEETWYTAAETVTAGLADRVAVIPDAGEAATVGDEEPVIVVVPLDGDEDSAHTTRIATFATARTNKLPSSSEPGNPNRKENAVAYSDLQAGIRERLGVTDANASDETLFAAFDEALAERAEPETPVSTIPEGAVVMDAASLTELREQAAQGAQALEQQHSARRDTIIEKALADGRIAASSQEGWRAQLDKDEDGIATLLGSFPKNTVPVAEVGHSDTVNNAEDALYAQAWGQNEKEA
ncbi:MAG: head maturation protease, ClpP-related [Rhodoglobus sp.]